MSAETPSTAAACGNASAVALALRAEIRAWDDVFFAKTQRKPTQQDYKTDPAIRKPFPLLCIVFFPRRYWFPLSGATG